MDGTSRLEVRLIGPFALRDAEGHDRTPRSAKARGLVALLALSPDHQRPRRWIEARLWSDRSPQQASGSLRQCLIEIRLALGPLADLLESTRETVRLAPLVTDLDLDPDAAHAALAAGQEFLEGLSLRDPVFQSWLEEQRAALSQGPSRRTVPARPAAPLAVDEPTGLPFLIRTGVMPQGSSGFVALMLAEAVGQLVSEFATVRIFGPLGATMEVGPPDRGLVLHIEAAEQEGRMQLLAVLVARRTGEMVWSRRIDLAQDALSEALLSRDLPPVVFEAAEATVRAMPRLIGQDQSALRAESLVSRAVQEMFTFSAERLRLADQLLAEATRLTVSPRIHAWRALLRQIQAVERTEPDRARIVDEAELFARRALEAPEPSSFVQALASQVQSMLLGRTEASQALARTALERSPNNPFALSARAGALLRENRPDEALADALGGAHIARRTGLLQWWESLAGHAAVLARDFPAARQHFEAAHARAPQFRVPLRNLLFLYLQCNEPEKALVVLHQLKRLEPDFSMDRIRQDPAYPTGMLRRAALLDMGSPE